MAYRGRNILLTVTTTLMIISFGIRLVCVDGNDQSTTLQPTESSECLRNLKNIAAYEGDENIIMNLTGGPIGVSWKIKPNSDELSTYTISNYSGYRDPTLSGLFYLNQSGLVILNATTTDYGGPISTTGLYYTQCESDGIMTGAKLLVIRSGPHCSCAPINSTASSVSCAVIFADSTFDPINAIVTWRVNGAFLATYTLERTRIDPYVFLSHSTITIDAASPDNYECELTFSEADVSQFPFVVTKAPEFNKACSTQEFGTTTTNKPSTSTSSTTTRLSTSPVSSPAATTTPKPPSFSSSSTSTTTKLSTTSTTSTAATIKLSTSSGQLTTTTINRPSASTSSTTTTAPSTTGFPISMEPLFGPVAGGTSITMTGPSPIDHPPSNSRSNIPDLGDAINVYIGSDLSAKTAPLSTGFSSTFGLVAVTPNTTEASIGQHLPVIIEFSSNISIFNMTCNKTFTFLPNPEIASLYPNSFIVNGGILLDVIGRHLSSVAKPIIQLTVVITRAAENSSTSNTTTRFCTVPPGNDTYMQCPMPPLNLPDDFLEIINSLYNTNLARRRRSGDPINHLIANSHSLLSRVKRDMNVLTVNGSNGVDRADIYLGFILDGYKEYENINDAFPDTRITFYLPPEIISSDELIQFDPSVDELIHVKGRFMMRGCLLRDYLVHIGNQTCINSDLQDNQLSCRPPKVEPSITMNDSAYCHQHLSIRITVGYKQYQYACLTYTDHSRRLALIIGLTVGLGVFVILLTILIVCIVRCRNSKVREETDRLQHTRGVELRNRHTQNAERPGSKRDLNIIHTRQNTMTIYKPDDDNATSLQQESQQDYGQQIQEYDDYLQPNGDYLTPIDDE